MSACSVEEVEEAGAVRCECVVSVHGHLPSACVVCHVRVQNQLVRKCCSNGN